MTLGSQRRAGMTTVIQLSYILRGLLKATKPTYKKGHSLTIYIPFVLLESFVVSLRTHLKLWPPSAGPILIIHRKTHFCFGVLPLISGQTMLYVLYAKYKGSKNSS